ncbi:unnamed protein product [Darwinula stevensoni]|uniref:Adipose-secreted signaling protein n=1 Tax=Darwinula stevensoni TaxID=69355 RepID=A0A7R9A2R4_9CRUS|nr:unnamed protein product [Darwinula stevensoni]CAG0889199.1 unnamed protein product [Darwinula stevensoni]
MASKPSVQVQNKSEEEHHVQFNDDAFHTDDLKIIKSTASKFVLHIGFLKLQHRYEMKFEFPDLELSEQLEQDPSQYARLLSVQKKPDNSAEMIFEYFAHKEGLNRDAICLRDPSHPDIGAIHIEFHSRVLSHKKGTPMLKNGIRCIANEREEESEASDWPGFEH